MRIEIPQKALSESQKAKIVARGETLSRNNLYFEMDTKYAATLARLYNAYGEHFKVEEEPLYIFFDDYTSQDNQYGYNEEGAWVKLVDSKNIALLLAERYADGEIALGGNVDAIMQELADTYQRIDEIRANNKIVEAEKKRKEEEERPAREAQEKAEKEKRAKEEAEKKAKAEEEKARQAAEAETKRQQRIAWAKEHGSERLRKGLEQGHACIKLYETELGEYLIADRNYEYDRDNKVELKDRSCPSLDALNEVERINQIEGLSASTVWLPEGLTEIHKDPEEYFELESGCEAVRIDIRGTAGYWYKKF